MVAPHRSKSHISESEQELLKKSRDDKYNVLAFELLKEVSTGAETGSLIRQSASNNDLAMEIDDTTTTDVIYQGWALPGTATSAASWKVRKIDISSGASISWADGDTNFDNVWDNIASLSYS